MSTAPLDRAILVWYRGEWCFARWRDTRKKWYVANLYMSSNEYGDNFKVWCELPPPYEVET